MTAGGELVKLTKKDFESDQEVRWCPGCGDYAILASVQKILPELDIPKENVVFISGIGCSSRFPYYMNTFGFHTIHGRAPAVATGVKLTNPELSVWVVTGDGDGFSIGGNHLMHLFRRNVDLNVLLFNNRIYGLTKGQYSPTSEAGKVTKSTPLGSLDEPVNPAAIALASKATFVARALAVDAKGLTDVLRRATAHKGTSFIEIFQNCNVFNDGAFDDFGERKLRKSQQVQLNHGKPLVFGDEDEKGIILEGTTPKVVNISQHGSSEGLIHYDSGDKSLAFIMANLARPEFPVPMGVLYEEDRPSYDSLLHQQIEDAQQEKGKPSLENLLKAGATWEVK